jgi:hypothetical protein
MTFSYLDFKRQEKQKVAENDMVRAFIIHPLHQITSDSLFKSSSTEGSTLNSYCNYIFS